MFEMRYVGKRGRGIEINSINDLESALSVSPQSESPARLNSFRWQLLCRRQIEGKTVSVRAMSQDKIRSYAESLWGTKDPSERALVLQALWNEIILWATSRNLEFPSQVQNSAANAKTSGNV
jgi:hypothetical protein